jgi:hypothetical protein
MNARSALLVLLLLAAAVACYQIECPDGYVTVPGKTYLTYPSITEYSCVSAAQVLPPLRSRAELHCPAGFSAAYDEAHDKHYCAVNE